MKELGVDGPALKILGGSSIADFVKAALEKMTELLGGASPKHDEENHAPQAHAPGMLVPEIVPPASDASGSSSGSRSPDFTPALQLHGFITILPSSEEFLDKLRVSIKIKAVCNFANVD